MRVPGFTSTASKRPEALFGGAEPPLRMSHALGCRIWDEAGREYYDTVMALGAVALGYAHEAVSRAAATAMRKGVVGSLAPSLEGELAERLAEVLPGVEAVRFLKTGAEAVAAAVRIARVHTGRDRVITCGYHGWLDWCRDDAGVPQAVRVLRREVPFNDVGALERAVEEHGPVAAIVIEPLVDDAPRTEWLEGARRLATRVGAVLVFDEIKTAFRLAVGGVAERSGITPDLMAVGKALGNGFPIAAVGGNAALMAAATRTWISSTLATEIVSLAAARAVLDVFQRETVIDALRRSGEALMASLSELAAAHPILVRRVRGVPQMCYLEFTDDARSAAVAQAAARRGLLFKRGAYNFVSYAHDDAAIGTVHERLSDAMGEVAARC